MVINKYDEICIFIYKKIIIIGLYTSLYIRPNNYQFLVSAYLEKFNNKFLQLTQ